MVFPSNRVDGKMNINGARGFLRQIADRMDLTLESIRRHFRGEPSPLGATLARYAVPEPPESATTCHASTAPTSGMWTIRSRRTATVLQLMQMTVTG